MMMLDMGNDISCKGKREEKDERSSFRRIVVLGDRV